MIHINVKMPTQKLYVLHLILFIFCLYTVTDKTYHSPVVFLSVFLCTDPVHVLLQEVSQVCAEFVVGLLAVALNCVLPGQVNELSGQVPLHDTRSVRLNLIGKLLDSRYIQVGPAREFILSMTKMHAWEAGQHVTDSS